MGSGFSQKTAPSQKLGSQWQKSSKPQSTPWQSQTKSSTAAKPNYTVNFSVIGGREERGVRAPSFGKIFECVLLIMSHVKLAGCAVTCRSSSTFIFLFTFVSTRKQNNIWQIWYPAFPKLSQYITDELMIAQVYVSLGIKSQGYNYSPTWDWFCVSEFRKVNLIHLERDG